jgi:hypothetical protein
MTWFGDENLYVVAKNTAAPQTVDTVAAHRVINGKHIVAAVSGGVRIEPAKFAARENIKTSRSETVAYERKSSTPPVSVEQWWWD